MLFRLFKHFVPAVVIPIKYYSRGPPALYKVDVSNDKKEMTITDLFALLHKKNLTFKDIFGWGQPTDAEIIRNSQKFILERHETLGPDLAAAHFILYRGGKVRFRDQDQWMDYYSLCAGIIPDTYVPNLFIEEVDASETQLCYEGFTNLVYLRGLKTLLLRNCRNVDDFCLQRTHVMEGSLEHLDISGCTNVTERGLCTLYRLRKLKKLVIDEKNNIAHKELTCMLLQDKIPQLEVDGVDFNDPSLHRKLRKYLE